MIKVTKKPVFYMIYNNCFEFSLENLKFKEGYEYYLEIIQKNQRKENQLKKIMIFISPLLMMIFANFNFLITYSIIFLLIIYCMIYIVMNFLI